MISPTTAESLRRRYLFVICPLLFLFGGLATVGLAIAEWSLMDELLQAGLASGLGLGIIFSVHTYRRNWRRPLTPGEVRQQQSTALAQGRYLAVYASIGLTLGVLVEFVPAVQTFVISLLGVFFVCVSILVFLTAYFRKGIFRESER